VIDGEFMGTLVNKNKPDIGNYLQKCLKELKERCGDSIYELNPIYFYSSDAKNDRFRQLLDISLKIFGAGTREHEIVSFMYRRHYDFFEGLAICDFSLYDDNINHCSVYWYNYGIKDFDCILKVIELGGYVPYEFLQTT
jgi:hypothetical protein